MNAPAQPAQQMTTATAAPAQSGHNKTIGERCHDAKLDAADKKSAAEKSQGMTKRKLSHLAIHYKSQGLSGAMAMEAARNDTAYHEEEDKMFDAMKLANLARAEAEGLECLFEQWRTESSTRRAEMNLR